eukprot:m.37191 g.37191  ORF g.37191 m.37191 type:complete len:69 (+) comp10082_c0_seq1:783-989(+)
MAGEDSLRALSNELNFGGMARWTWRTYHKYPMVIMATAMGVVGCGLFAVNSGFRKQAAEKRAQNDFRY